MNSSALLQASHSLLTNSSTLAEPSMASNSHGLGERIAALVKEAVKESNEHRGLDASALREQILSNARLLIHAGENDDQLPFDSRPGLTIAMVPTGLNTTRLIAHVLATAQTLSCGGSEFIVYISGEESDSDTLALQSLDKATKTMLLNAMSVVGAVRKLT